ncbi:MAG: hypothetical protein WB783_11580 [Arenicellales bacterium]
MRTVIYAITVLVLSAAALTTYFLTRDQSDFDDPGQVITDPGLRHPADVIKFKGSYVATELYDNRLAVFDDLGLRNLRYFDPKRIGKRFKAPHYLAVTPWHTLLISNGWGRSIVEIADLNGDGWKEFSGIGRKFNAPHGVCVDDEGWIYVGDSLNSRLVRFRDMNGGDWQVFADVDKQVSYIRELYCKGGAVWASNSYERRPGLNPGRGSKLLRITDFESGKATTVFSIKDTNMTAALPLNRGKVLVGLWGARRRLAIVDTHGRLVQATPYLGMGTPYGSYLDHTAGRLLVTYIGALSGSDHIHIGGIAVYRP